MVEKVHMDVLSGGESDWSGILLYLTEESMAILAQNRLTVVDIR